MVCECVHVASSIWDIQYRMTLEITYIGRSKTAKRIKKNYNTCAKYYLNMEETTSDLSRIRKAQFDRLAAAQFFFSSLAPIKFIFQRKKKSKKVHLK